MARQRRRTRPGDAANIFVRAVLAEASALLGGFTEEEWARTIDYFGGKCAYTGEPLVDGRIDQDHVVPMNMSSGGLHLYGNVLPVTKSANAKKHAKSLKEHVREPDRLARIEAFVRESGYEARSARLGDLRNYCRSVYEAVNGLVAASRAYLRGLLPAAEAAPTPAVDGSRPAVLVRRPDEVLPISLSPDDERVFRDALLRTRLAWITTYYEDGRVETRPWRADRFSRTSSVIGNLRTRPEHRRGTWRQAGIVRVAVSIERPSSTGG